MLQVGLPPWLLLPSLGMNCQRCLIPPISLLEMYR